MNIKITNTKKTKSTSSGGIGFMGLLTLIFISLKLTGHIAWSWWWVLSPLWSVFALMLAILLLSLIAHFIYEMWMK